MILGARFFNDMNITLQNVQHDLYWILLPKLYMTMRDCYMRAVRYVNVTTDLSETIAKRDSAFDHRVLQEPHDIMAARYRYDFPDKVGQLLFPFALPDCTHLNAEDLLKEYYRRSWSSHWYGEVKRLSEEPVIVRAILKAVLYQNKDEGYEAEDLLNELLYDLYGKYWDKNIHLTRRLKKYKY